MTRPPDCCILGRSNTGTMNRIGSRTVKTDIELDDNLPQEAMGYSHWSTAQAVIEEAPRTFLDLKRQKGRARYDPDRVRPLQGTLSALKLRTPRHPLLREDGKRPRLLGRFKKR
jgi:Arc/MetJ family transcription regulator